MTRLKDIVYPDVLSKWRKGKCDFAGDFAKWRRCGLKRAVFVIRMRRAKGLKQGEWGRLQARVLKNSRGLLEVAQWDMWFFAGNARSDAKNDGSGTPPLQPSNRTKCGHIVAVDW
jgi:hypothetical protein